MDITANIVFLVNFLLCAGFFSLLFALSRTNARAEKAAQEKRHG